MSIDLAARHAWMAAVCADRKLSPTALRVAMLIGLHLNQKTGRCDPAKETLARKLGTHVRSVDRAISMLVELGWLAVERSRGRAPNNYALRRTPQLVNPGTAAGVEASNPGSGVNPTPAQLCRGNREENRTPLTPHGAASGADRGLARSIPIARDDPRWPELVEAMRQRKPGWKPPTVTVNVGRGPEPGWYFATDLVHPRAELRLVGPSG